MNLFVTKDFVMHSGDIGHWKIECDALTDEDLATIALMLSGVLPPFGEVYGVPTGGTRIAKAMREYQTDGPMLIVDDVLTTGNSMEGARQGLVGGHPIWWPAPIGAVIFSRGKVPDWITPLFRMPVAL